MSLVRISPDGEELSTIEQGLVPYSESILDVEISGGGTLHLLISTSSSFRLEAWSPEGTLLSTLVISRTPGRTIGDLAFDAFGTAWILDTSDRLLRVDPARGAGAVTAWNYRRAELDFVPTGIGWSPDGLLYVMDGGAPRVLVFDRVLNYQGEFGAGAPTDPGNPVFSAGDFGRSFAFLPDGYFAVATSPVSVAIFR
jgi:hypothetical protein